MNVVPDSSVWLRWLGARAAPRRGPDRPRWRVYLSAIVLQELWAGVRGSREAEDLRRLYDLARRGRRLLTPSAPAWIRSGQVLAELIGRRRLGAARLRAMRNDVLLAVTAVFADATVLTENAADFEIVAQVIPVRYERA